MATKAAKKTPRTKKSVYNEKIAPAKKGAAPQKKAKGEALAPFKFKKSNLTEITQLMPGESAVRLLDPNIEFTRKPTIVVTNKGKTIEIQISVTIKAHQSNPASASGPVNFTDVGDYAIFLKDSQTLTPNVNEFKAMFQFSNNIQITADKLDIPANKGNHG